mmetsp:Transcript_99415/g.281509  ORF Transcript_99415/g.281509 Transcript_99415/m.281509 type:complete len:141 (-) Transcript_99415:131-553(-)
MAAVPPHGGVVPGGMAVANAEDLLPPAGRPEPHVHIYDGQSFRRVLGCELCVETTEVIEVTFDGDAPVLAWVLPKRSRSVRPPLRDEAAVCCLGSRLRPGDALWADLELRGGSLLPRSPRPSPRRSRSADAVLQRGPAEF